MSDEAAAGKLVMERNAKRKELKDLGEKRSRFINSLEIIPKILWGECRIAKQSGNTLEINTGPTVKEFDWPTVDEFVQMNRDIPKLTREIESLTIKIDQIGQ